MSKYKLDKSAQVVENSNYIMTQEEVCERLNDLQSQLAEKEGKIETLKQRIESIVKIYSDDFVSKDTELKELRHKVKQHNQDKISFAVEQLTEIRDYVKECWSLETTEGKVRLDIAKKIRLKIEELTHQHEDKGESK